VVLFVLIEVDTGVTVVVVAVVGLTEIG